MSGARVRRTAGPSHEDIALLTVSSLSWLPRLPCGSQLQRLGPSDHLAPDSKVSLIACESAGEGTAEGISRTMALVTRLLASPLLNLGLPAGCWRPLTLDKQQCTMENLEGPGGHSL